ncbi:dehydrogenase [Microbacterium awajiense]
MAPVPASSEPAAEPPELRNVLLVDALQTQDVAAVAFALRHGPTVVPIVRPADGETGDPDGAIWTYRDPGSGQNVLLLFSDAAHRPETLPVDLALLSPGALRTFLAVQGDEISAVFFDVAGPHPMKASPPDIIAALDA